MFKPNPDHTFSAIRPLRESMLSDATMLAYVVNRQRIVKRETGRILAEREEIATLTTPNYLHNSDDRPQGATRLADAASAVGGFTIRYGTADQHESAQVRYSNGVASIAPTTSLLDYVSENTERPESWGTRAPYLSDYAYHRPDGLYYVSEQSAYREYSDRERAAKLNAKRKRAGRVTAPCFTLDLHDLNGEPIAIPCEHKSQAQRVHAGPANVKARNRCLARLRKVAQRERDAQAANAYEDAPQDAQRVASAVATNASNWIDDQRA